MGARECEATREAIKLHKGGLSIRKAAAAAGVAPSTLVRALAREAAATARKLAAKPKEQKP